MSNDPKSTKEKLLRASGIKTPASDKEELLQLRNEMVDRIDSMVYRVEQVDSRAQETKRLMEQMLERLENFCDQKLPAHMTKVIETTTQQGLNRALYPFEQSLNAAAQRIHQCQQELTHLSWNWRLLAGPLIVGFFTALLSAGMVRCTHQQTVDDAREYELFGRKVKKVIGLYSAEQQRKIYDWIEGVPQPPAKKEGKKRR